MQKVLHTFVCSSNYITVRGNRCVVAREGGGDRALTVQMTGKGREVAMGR